MSWVQAGELERMGVRGMVHTTFSRVYTRGVLGIEGEKSKYRQVSKDTKMS